MPLWGRRAPIVVGDWREPPEWKPWQVVAAVVMAVGIVAMVATCW